MNKRDLKTDLEAIRKGATLFGNPNRKGLTIVEHGDNPELLEVDKNA